MTWWGHVWYNGLPITALKVSQNEADVIVSSTCASVINERKWSSVTFTACKSMPQRGRWLWMFRDVTFLSFNYFYIIKKRALRWLVFTRVWKNRRRYCLQWVFQRYWAEPVEDFYLAAGKYGKRRDEQREATAITHLWKLLFNSLSVLQCQQLLFGALCCQSLARRAEHVAEKDTRLLRVGWKTQTDLQMFTTFY